VDDAAQLTATIRANRHDVATVALRHQRILNRGMLEIAVDALEETAVGSTKLLADRAQSVARAIEHFTFVADATPDALFDSGQLDDEANKLVQLWKALIRFFDTPE
jgi:hypothetical protein